jgi:hypothetical protein
MYIIIRMIKSEKMRWARELKQMEKLKDAFKSLVGKPEEKEPLARPWDDVKMNLN